MTDDQIREAGRRAVAEFPPMPDDLAAKVGHLIAELSQTGEEVAPDERRDRAA